MTIRLDISPNSVVVYCTDCGHWRAFAWTREEGEISGDRHEANVHPEAMDFRRQTERNRRSRAARHAADSIVPPLRPEYSVHGNSRSARPRPQQS